MDEIVTPEAVEITETTVDEVVTPEAVDVVETVETRGRDREIGWSLELSSDMAGVHFRPCRIIAFPNDITAPNS